MRILDPRTGEHVEIRVPVQPVPMPGLAERRSERIAEKLAARNRIAERIAQPSGPGQEAQEK